MAWVLHRMALFVPYPRAPTLLEYIWHCSMAGRGDRVGWQMRYCGLWWQAGRLTAT